MPNSVQFCLALSKCCRGDKPRVFPMPNAQCPIPHSQCLMPSAQCPIPHSQFPMLNVPRKDKILWLNQ
ncbi:MAG: hypothetical protein V7L04_12140 [Nostoc sp.]|uniref:hypothetical protein n=1 Tax=Nostoc sp. TaxID=1180 RepID=UPI002FFA1D23